jgi:hypothetical protein
MHISTGGGSDQAVVHLRAKNQNQRAFEGTTKEKGDLNNSIKQYKHKKLNKRLLKTQFD